MVNGKRPQGAKGTRSARRRMPWAQAGVEAPVKLVLDFDIGEPVPEGRAGVPDCPELALRRGVLERAMLDLRTMREARRVWGRPERAATVCQRIKAQRAERAYQEVWGWFASDDAAWAFAFVPVCETLGLEPGAVRQAILYGEVARVGAKRPRRVAA